jgi:hypothetical protein
MVPVADRKMFGAQFLRLVGRAREPFWRDTEPALGADNST